MTVQQQNAAESRKIKRRGWVKNAAIIFLSVMLVLTFFSGTIMNYSLPEVAAKYVGYGSIATQIRGTGMVSANQVYDVSIDETRKIKSVAVRAGDVVEAGQTLFLLEDTESQELKSAVETLENLEYEYEEMLLDMEDPDYSAMNKAISNLRDDIAKAKEDLAKLRQRRNKITTNPTILADPETAQFDAQLKVDSLGSQIEDIQEKIAELEGEIGGAEGTSEAIKEKYDTLVTLNLALNRAIEDYRTSYGGADSYSKPLSQYLNDILNEYDRLVNNKEDYDADTDAAEKITAIRSIQDQSTAVEKATQDYYAALGQQSGSSANAGTLQSLNQILDSLKDEQKIYQQIAEQSERLATTDGEIEAAENAVDGLEEQLTQKQQELSDQKKADGKTEDRNNLILERKEKEIEKQKAAVEQLKAKTVDAQITADIGGTITELTKVAGETANAGESLATIEVTEKGHTVSFSVTNEQAKQIKVGEQAGVQDWWYSEITVTVVSVKNDPANPGRGKIVTCNVKGEVTVGQTLNLTVGQRNTSYDCVVPTSAVREDNNGKFVLVIEAKSSPLGNRYFVRRYDVQVIAADETNTAVSGLYGNEFIVTTSTKPLEPGMQVRLPD